MYFGNVSFPFKFKFFSSGSTIAAVCQVEVVVVAIVTGFIVHFLTKFVIKQKSILSQNGSGNTAEHGPLRTINRPLPQPPAAALESSMSTGEDVELSLSPAYEPVSDYMPEYL